jgi:hypothetical protein
VRVHMHVRWRRGCRILGGCVGGAAAAAFATAAEKPGAESREYGGGGRQVLQQE